MNFKTKVRRVNKDKLISGHMYKVWLNPEDKAPHICLYLNKVFYAINNLTNGSFNGRLIHSVDTTDPEISYPLYKIERPLGLCDRIEDILRPDLELVECCEQFILSNFKVGEPYLITGIHGGFGKWGLFEGANVSEGTLQFAFIEGEHESFYTGDIRTIHTKEEIVKINEETRNNIKKCCGMRTQKVLESFIRETEEELKND